jgi:hypothetical protein
MASPLHPLKEARNKKRAWSASIGIYFWVDWKAGGIRIQNLGRHKSMEVAGKLATGKLAIRKEDSRNNYGKTQK